MVRDGLDDTQSNGVTEEPDNESIMRYSNDDGVELRTLEDLVFYPSNRLALSKRRDAVILPAL